MADPEQCLNGQGWQYCLLTNAQFMVEDGMMIDQSLLYILVMLLAFLMLKP